MKNLFKIVMLMLLFLGASNGLLSNNIYAQSTLINHSDNVTYGSTPPLSSIICINNAKYVQLVTSGGYASGTVWTCINNKYKAQDTSASVTYTGTIPLNSQNQIPVSYMQIFGYSGPDHSAGLVPDPGPNASTQTLLTNEGWETFGVAANQISIPSTTLQSWIGPQIYDPYGAATTAISSLTSAQLQTIIGPNVYDPYGAAANAQAAAEAAEALASQATGNYIPMSEKDVPEGVAVLDDNSYILQSEVPPLFPIKPTVLCNYTPETAIACTQAQIVAILGNYYDTYGSAQQATTLAEQAQATANADVPKSSANQPGGYAELTSAGQIPSSEIGAISVNNVYPVTSQAAMLALTGTAIGDMAINTTTGQTYILAMEPASTLTNWIAMAAGAGVASVNGMIGVVDLGFSNITGTVSSAQLPYPTTSSLGGVEAINPVTSMWVNGISPTGVPTLSQPSFSDLTGAITCSQLPQLNGGVSSSGCTVDLMPAAVASALAGQPISVGALTATSITAPNLTIGDCVEVTTGGVFTSVPCGGGSGSGSGGVELNVPNTWTGAQTFDGGIITNSITDNALTIGNCVVVGTGGVFTSTSCGSSGNASLAQANTWTELQTFQSGVVASTMTDQALTPGMCVEAGTGGVLESVACGSTDSSTGSVSLSQENIFTMPQEINLTSTATIDGLQIYDITISSGSSVAIVVGNNSTSSGNAAVFGYEQGTTTNYGTVAINGGATTTFDASGNWIMPGQLTTSGITDNNTLSVTGASTLNSVTATNMAASGTLSASGTSTLEVVTATNISASGTLAVTGASTLSAVTATNVIATNVTDSALTSGQCLEAGTGGMIVGVNCSILASAGATNVSTLTDSGTLTVDGASSLAAVTATNISASGTLAVTGFSTLAAVSETSETNSGTLSVTGSSTLASVTATSLADSSLTSGQCLEAASNGEIVGVNCSTIAATGITSVTTLTDEGTLTVDGASSLASLSVTGTSTLASVMATNVTDSALTTVGDCVTVGTGGLLSEVTCSSGAAMLSVANAFTQEQTISGVATGLDVISNTSSGTASAAMFSSMITGTGRTIITVGNNLGSAVFGYSDPGPVTNPNTGITATTLVGEVGLSGGSMSTFDSLGDWTIPGEVTVTGTGIVANSLTDAALVNGECVIAGPGGLVESEPCTQTSGGAGAGSNTFTGDQIVDLIGSSLTTAYGFQLEIPGLLTNNYALMTAGLDLSTTNDSAFFGFENVGGAGSATNLGVLGITGSMSVITFNNAGMLTAPSITDAALTTVGDCVTVGAGGLLSQAVCGGSGAITGALTVTDNTTAEDQSIATFLAPNLTGATYSMDITVGTAASTGNSVQFGFESYAASASNFGWLSFYDSNTYTKFDASGDWTMPGYVSAANLYDTALTTVGDCVTVGTGGLLGQATCGGAGATLGANTFTAAQTISSGTNAWPLELSSSSTAIAGIEYQNTSVNSGDFWYSGVIGSAGWNAAPAGSFAFYDQAAVTDVASFYLTGTGAVANTLTDLALTTVGDCVTVGTGGLLGEAPCGGGTATNSSEIDGITVTGTPTVGEALTATSATTADWVASTGVSLSVANTWTAAQTFDVTGPWSVAIEGSATNVAGLTINNTTSEQWDMEVTGSAGNGGAPAGSFAFQGNALVTGTVPMYLTATGVFMPYTLSVTGASTLAAVTETSDTDSGTLAVTGAATLHAVTSTTLAATTSITDSGLTTVGDCVTVGTGGLLSQATCGSAPLRGSWSYASGTLPATANTCTMSNPITVVGLTNTMTIMASFATFVGEYTLTPDYNGGSVSVTICAGSGDLLGATAAGTINVAAF